MNEAFAEGSERAFKKSEAAMAEAKPDTMAQWLRQRFSPQPFKTGDKSEGWDAVSDTEKAYWEHEAAAVKRAAARGGFKEMR